MCGIVGYIGENSCINIIYNGLKTLEYRGYDSAGIAVLDDQNIFLTKSKGKLNSLESSLPTLPAKAKVGIGHTRWATHGKPETINAHPHTEERFAIVHNGIIENYLEIKEKLINDGVVFKSETDTEVVLHLLSKIYLKHNDMIPTLVELVKKLKGAFAIGIIDKNNDKNIYIVKHGSPAVIGLGDNENFFASDAYALISHTNKAVYLQDGQFACLHKNGFEVYNFDGTKTKPAITQLDCSPASLDKQGYRHYMLKEIYEQPAVISKLIERFIDANNNTLLATGLNLDSITLNSNQRIHLVACGSAYYAACTTKYYLEQLLKIPVNIELASEFRYRQPFVNKNDLFIAVSQSGETLDTLTSVKYAKSLGAKIITVCNVEQSSIAREADIVCYMQAGPEIGVASTKAFSAQILALYFVFLNIAKKHKLLDNEAKICDELRKLPPQIEQALNQASSIEELSSKYFKHKNFLFIGRGLSSAIAYEGALKLKEISYIHAEAYPGGELKHGPIALVDENTPTVAIIPHDFYEEKMKANVEEIKARDGKIIAVTDKTKISVAANDTIHTPTNSNPVAQSILCNLPLQLLAYYTALKLGTDIDQPRNLAKSVTVE